MKFADGVWDSTITVGPGPINLAGLAPTNYQPVVPAIPIGETFPYRIEHQTANEWENGIGTVTGAHAFSRTTVTSSSNAGALVSFSVGTKNVFCTVTAAQFAKMAMVDTIPFATAVPLTRPGQAEMPPQNVASVLAFTPAANPVPGAFAFAPLVADGLNAPTFVGFTEHGGSMGYDNRAGILNLVQFFYLGGVFWYSVTQAANAVPVDLVAPTAASAAVANATPTVVTVTASEALDPSFIPAASTITVGGHAASSVTVAGATFNVTCATPFAYGEAARAIAYVKPSSNGLRDSAGNLMESFSGLAITNNLAPPATAPAQMAAPTATAAVSSATVTLVAPANGGSPITGYTVSSNPAGGVDTAAGTTALTRTISGLTAGTPTTFTAVATNAVGSSPASPASASVTPLAAATVPGAPTIGAAVAGDGYVDVAFTAPASNGGAAILDYTATLSTGETATGASSPIRVTAANGAARTATVKARNGVGSSAASAASNSVTPTAVVYPRLGSLLRLTESGTGPYGYAGTGGGFGSGTEGSGRLTVALPANTDGSFAFRQPNLPISQGNTMMIGFDSATGGVAYSAIDYGMAFYNGKYAPFFNGAEQTINGAAVSNAANDTMRVRRGIVGGVGTVYLEVSKDGGTSWALVHSAPCSTGILYGYIISSNNGVADNLSTLGMT